MTLETLTGRVRQIQYTETIVYVSPEDQADRLENVRKNLDPDADIELANDPDIFVQLILTIETTGGHLDGLFVEALCPECFVSPEGKFLVRSARAIADNLFKDIQAGTLMEFVTNGKNIIKIEPKL